MKSPDQKAKRDRGGYRHGDQRSHGNIPCQPLSRLFEASKARRPPSHRRQCQGSVIRELFTSFRVESRLIVKIRTFRFANNTPSTAQLRDGMAAVGIYRNVA